MNILFVNQFGYEAPAVINIHELAENLSAHGHSCMLAIPAEVKKNKPPEGRALYNVIEYEFSEGRLDPVTMRVIKSFSPDVIHAWNPRHIIARVCLEVTLATEAVLVVNHEDDERSLACSVHDVVDPASLFDLLEGPFLQPKNIRTFTERYNWKRLQFLLNNPMDFNQPDPLFYGLLNRFSAGYTAIWNPLYKQVKTAYQKPVLCLPPCSDLTVNMPHTMSATERAAICSKYNLPVDRCLLLFLGTNYSFSDDFDLLLHALGSDTCRNEDWHLFIVGRNFRIKKTENLLQRYGIEDRFSFLGFKSGAELLALTHLADVALCPGQPNEFNRLRLPSKIPFYMALGKPLFTYRTGFGESLTDGENALLTLSGNPEEWAQRLQALITSPVLRKQIGEGAREFALRHFDVSVNARSLVAFYEQLVKEKKVRLAGDALEMKLGSNKALRQALMLAKQSMNRPEVKNIAIYGAGQHTKRIFEQTYFAGCNITAVFDDNPKSQKIDGVPVYSADCSDKVQFDLLLISSDTYEDKMLERARCWVPAKVPILAPYRNLRESLTGCKEGGRTPPRKVDEGFHSCLMCSGLFLKANGTLTCWCNEGYGLELGDMRIQHVGDFVTGPEITNIRESYKSGFYPHRICSRCIAKKHEPVPDQSAGIAIHVEPTNCCNLMCPHCICTSERQSSNPPPRCFLPIELYTKSLNEVAERGVKVNTLFFCGYGEPVLHPKLAQMAEIARSLFPKTFIYLDTNGNIASEKAAELANCGIDLINIGADGADQTSYVKYRKKGSYELCRDFMAELSRQVHEVASSTKIMWKYILFDHNDSDEQIRSALKQAEDINVDIVFHVTASANRSKRSNAEISALVGMQRMASYVDDEFLQEDQKIRNKAH